MKEKTTLYLANRLNQIMVEMNNLALEKNGVVRELVNRYPSLKGNENLNFYENMPIEEIARVLVDLDDRMALLNHSMMELKGIYKSFQDEISKRYDNGVVAEFLAKEEVRRGRK